MTLQARWRVGSRQSGWEGVAISDTAFADPFVILQTTPPIRALCIYPPSFDYCEGDFISRREAGYKTNGSSSISKYCGKVALRKRGTAWVQVFLKGTERRSSSNQ